MNEAALAKERSVALENKIYDSILELQSIKRQHPELRSRLNMDSVDAVIHGYRMGEFTLGQANSMLKLRKPLSTNDAIELLATLVNTSGDLWSEALKAYKATPWWRFGLKRMRRCRKLHWESMFYSFGELYEALMLNRGGHQ